MFDSLPAEIAQLRGTGDAAACVDAAVGWGKIAAASEAQRLAAIAEFALVFLAETGDDMSLWAVDEEDAVVAQIGAAFGVSPRWAMGDLEIGIAMRERFPSVAALFLRGEVSAKVMATVVERTMLVTDEQALAAIDAACAEAAAVAGWSGLSYYKLKNAVDVWVDRHDPAAVRRGQGKLRNRGVTVYDNDDASGTTAILIRLSTPGAALLVNRLRRMAKAVCKNDPRTLDQRMADAAEALAADANHLACRCGSPSCPAAATDGVASRFVIHIYAEAAALDGHPDPLIHGEHPADDARADNVTVTHRGRTTPSEDRPAAPPHRAAECHAPEPAEEATPTVTPPPPSTRVGPPGGVIAGFGLVPNSLIAALIAAGAPVHQLRAPAIDASDGYRIPDELRAWLRARDLYCRFPGCDRPIEFCDLDHSIPWDDGGPTHASNLKGYCRHHHLLKTFHDGWSESQSPDGTIILTTPTGHSHSSIPTSRLLFPTVDTTSAPVQRGSPRKDPGGNRTANMPKRKRTKAKDRAYRIAAERALNDAHLARRNEKPEF